MTESDCLKGKTTANMSTFFPKMRNSKKRHDEERCCRLSFPTKTSSQIGEKPPFSWQGQGPDNVLFTHLLQSSKQWYSDMLCRHALPGSNSFCGLEIELGTQKEKKSYSFFGHKVPDESTEFISHFTFTDATKLNAFITFLLRVFTLRKTLAFKIIWGKNRRGEGNESKSN